MRKKYNTPHRRHVVKTRLSDEEHADFMERLAAYHGVLMGVRNPRNLLGIKLLWVRRYSVFLSTYPHFVVAKIHILL